jgi:hypothetical protein
MASTTMLGKAVKKPSARQKDSSDEKICVRQCAMLSSGAKGHFHVRSRAGTMALIWLFSFGNLIAIQNHIALAWKRQ